MTENGIQARYRAFTLSLSLLLLALLMVALAATPALAEPINGDTAMSWGAGNEVTGDLLMFKNKKKGAFTAMRAEAGDFEVQTLRKAIKRGSKKIYNVAAGVKVNAEDDRVIYTARTNTLTLNGAPLLLTDGESATEIDGGGTVEKSGTFYTITSEAGDVVRLVDVNKYVNVEIQAGPNRQADELKGYLGQFDTDSDPNNDLVFPEDQIQAASNSQFLHFVLEILTAWQVLLTLSMFA